MNEQPFKAIWKKGEAILHGIDGLFGGIEGDSKRGTRSLGRTLNPEVGPQMSIRQVMTQAPVTIQTDTPLHQAVGLLIKKDLSALPVMDEKGSIVGLVNERHVLNALGDLEATTVSAVMDPEPVTVGVDEPIVEVVDALMAINVRQVLVLEGSRLVGVVTRADLMPAILEIFENRTRHARGVSLAED